MTTTTLLLMIIMEVTYGIMIRFVYIGAYDRGTIGLYVITAITYLIYFLLPEVELYIVSSCLLFILAYHSLLNFFLSKRKQILITNITMALFAYALVISIYFKAKSTEYAFDLSEIILPLLIYSFVVYILDRFSRLIFGLILHVNEEIANSIGREEQTLSLVMASSEQLKKTSNLLSNANETTSSASEIQSNIERISKQIEKLNLQLNNSQDVISTLNNKMGSLDNVSIDQSANITESVSSIEEMTASIRNVTSIVNSKLEIVSALMVTSQKGAQTIEETVTSFQNLQLEMAKITEMTNVISGLASQTNLLSMNAAIEAAHAGDSGKGFSVVADEVRKLASSSAVNSGEISKTIKNIVDSFKQTDSMVQLSGQSFKELNNGIEDVQEAMSEIILSIEELNAGSKEILLSTTNLNELNINVRDGVNDVITGQKDLNVSLDGPCK